MIKNLRKEVGTLYWYVNDVRSSTRSVSTAFRFMLGQERELFECRCTHTHTHTYVHVHTHTYTHTHVISSFPLLFFFLFSFCFVRYTFHVLSSLSLRLPPTPELPGEPPPTTSQETYSWRPRLGSPRPKSPTLSDVDPLGDVTDGHPGIPSTNVEKNKVREETFCLLGLWQVYFSTRVLIWYITYIS